MDSVAVVEAGKPIRSFGLITDVHYADIDDRWNSSRTFIRRYRNSLRLVKEACQHWLNGPHPIAFIVQLGDLLDGFAEGNHTSDVDLQTILAQLKTSSLSCPIYHVWGNHEFYNFTRKQLLEGPLCSFETKNTSPGHYGTLEITPRLRLIALDTYELSLLGVEEDSEAYAQAMHYLRKSNPNDDAYDRTGLAGDQQRFIKLNGGVTDTQLGWLREQLTLAKNRQEKVIVVGHIPLHVNASDEIALVWNCEEVLETLWAFDGTVLAYIAGHCHEGGHFVDQKNIHHLTLQAVVECEPDINAFATVHAHEEYVIIEGSGRVGSYRIAY